ncbi:T9SS C-terminal target domain-containing protein [Sesbania bispinosa]|nr:T9SS C-terminal target domain-containing protein [Sesbania bispinosa]
MGHPSAMTNMPFNIEGDAMAGHNRKGWRLVKCYRSWSFMVTAKFQACPTHVLSKACKGT